MDDVKNTIIVLMYHRHKLLDLKSNIPETRVYSKKSANVGVMEWVIVLLKEQFYYQGLTDVILKSDCLVTRRYC
jgi:hypothetical protein